MTLTDWIGAVDAALAREPQPGTAPPTNIAGSPAPAPTSTWWTRLSGWVDRLAPAGWKPAAIAQQLLSPPATPTPTPTQNGTNK